jgi:trehalose 6-phosphate phosphatase
VEALLAMAPYRGRRPLFAGDDLTDENGFRAVEERGGVSIKIGAGETIATRRVSSPAAFRAWLTAFAAQPAAVETLGQSAHPG